MTISTSRPSDTRAAEGVAGPVRDSRPGAPPRIKVKAPIELLAWTLILLGLATASLLVGVYDVFGAPDGTRMLLLTRIPRTVSLLLAGAALSACGLVMQRLTRNRFVEPTTTGTTEWAGLGLLTALILTPEAPIVWKMVLAIVFSFGGTMLFFAILGRIRDTSALLVPIIGIMLGAVVGAVSTWIALATNALQSMGAWFMGSFASAIEGQYEPVWAVLLVLIGIAVVADRFTVAGLGKDVATSVGLDHGRTILVGTAMVASATGIITVVIGNLPFLGLIVPNIIALVHGDDLRSTLPRVLALGAATVTACDIIGRSIIMPFEIPVGTILSLLGAIVFTALLLKGGRGD